MNLSLWEVRGINHSGELMLIAHVVSEDSLSAAKAVTMHNPGIVISAVLNRVKIDYITPASAE